MSGNGVVTSPLKRLLDKGEFVVTSECGPPRGADAEVVKKKGNLVGEFVDGVNVTDNQTAVARMSSLASCIILKQMGLNPILQMVTRDRNRIALQSDILGAAAHGIENVLCLSGDHQSFGDHPSAKNVFDLDSIQLIMLVRRMRDEGKFLSGDEIKGVPKMFVGAAINPFADPFEMQVVRLAKKAKAGVEFVQSQCIFNVPKFAEFMEKVRARGLHEQIHILGGVTPMKSPGMAKYMATKVPGMDVPEELIQRMQAPPKEKRAAEGVKIAIETIQKLREIPGVRGVHVMAIEWEEVVGEIVKGAGLFPRPVVPTVT